MYSPPKTVYRDKTLKSSDIIAVTMLSTPEKLRQNKKKNIIVKLTSQIENKINVGLLTVSHFFCLQFLHLII